MCNRLGLYGAYFFGMSGIGFTLPYLPLYLRNEGLSDRTIGLISTTAALAGLVQFPVGLWSDHAHRRKPFLLAAISLLAIATVMLPHARGALAFGLLVSFFAENGACRATLESLAGAEAADFARGRGVGSALGGLRFWKPAAVVSMALVGGLLADRSGVASVLIPVTLAQTAAVAMALGLREDPSKRRERLVESSSKDPTAKRTPRDRALWIFVLAMVLFHVSNAPGGVYLGLHLKRTFEASGRLLSYAFIISNLIWMVVVVPAGRLADRIGRRPLLIVAWSAMTARLVLVALARSFWQILMIQILDGTAQALFAVVAAAWVTDRLARTDRLGKAQAIVGSALVGGSAIGPLIAGFIVDALGYRGMFAVLAGVGLIATWIVVAFVPETLEVERQSRT